MAFSRRATSRADRVFGPCAGAVGAFALMALPGCAPKIGSSCTLSTDCSSQGDRVCDTAQPGGYCTIIGCNSFSCPDHAVCVTFQPSDPGCPYTDYGQPSRTGVGFCMAQCGSDSDCRASEGYVCRNPTQAPWNAAIVSNDQSLAVCIYGPPTDDAGSSVATADGSVCQKTLPPVPDAASGDAAAQDAGGNADAEGPFDAAAEGAVTDAGAVDAPVGG